MPILQYSAANFLEYVKHQNELDRWHEKDSAVTKI